MDTNNQDDNINKELNPEQDKSEISSHQRIEEIKDDANLNSDAVQVYAYNVFILGNPYSGSQLAKRFIDQGLNSKKLYHRVTPLGDYSEGCCGCFSGPKPPKQQPQKSPPLNQQYKEMDSSTPNCAQIQVFNLITQMGEAIKQIEAMIKEHIKQGENKDKKIIVTTLGGDGSLGCTLDVLEAQSDYIMTNIQKIYLTTMPFGTGNDLSRSLGWGGIVKTPWMKDLYVMVNYLCQDQYDKLTIWECQMNANTYQFKSKSSKNTVVYNQIGTHEHPYKKKQLCYFNFGFDAEISFAVESWGRTKSRFKNKYRYGMAGVIYLCDRQYTYRMSRVVKQITQKSEETQEEKVILKQQDFQNTRDAILLLGINIPSNYGGEYQNNWYNTRNRIAYPNNNQQFSQQNYGDSKMEIIGLKNKSEFLKKSFYRYAQPDGSFMIEVNHEEIPEGQKHYLGLDGENYMLKDVKSIEWRRAPRSPTINVVRGPLPRHQT